jgi:plasmid stabilization system protein ParE
VVYQIQNERIEIVTVLHSRQDLRKKFRQRKE